MLPKVGTCEDLDGAGSDPVAVINKRLMAGREHMVSPNSSPPVLDCTEERPTGAQ